MTRHFHTLDGMRGIAALAVVLGHGSHFLQPLRVPGYYLAVDLFFVLSGFVIAHAYEQRLREGLSLRRFLVMRLIRFYPLYFLGCLIGAVSAVLAYLKGGGNFGAESLATSLVFGFLLLPSPTWTYEGWLVPVNVPGWSLIFELAVNMLYAAVLPLLSTRVVLAIVGLSMTALVASVLGFGDADLGSDWATLLPGLARVTVSFFVGVLVYRMPKPAVRGGIAPWLVAFSILPAFFYAPDNRAFFDLFCVAIFFPVVIYLASYMEASRPRIFQTLGAASFAVYAIHHPLMILVRRVTRTYGVTPDDLAPTFGIILVLALIPLCLALDRFYDRPVRRWITQRTVRRSLSSREKLAQGR